MENALVISDFDTMQRVSLALFKSKYFDDVESEAQAIVKVMAGAELGLPPFASMAGIHIIHGKPTLSSNIIATLVKNDFRYDYYIASCTNANCIIEWYENSKLVGHSDFSIEEAQVAGLAGKDIWKKYPSDMLFARAISRGARRFAPGIFGGAPVYTPDEMGADADEEGYVIEVEPVAKQAEPESTTKEPDSVAAANAELLGHDGTAEAQANTGKAKDLRAETSPQEQGKREEHRPKADNGFTVEDRREWLKSKFKNGNIELGIVGDAAAMTEHYNDWGHAKNTLTPNEETGNEGFDFPDGFKIIRAQKVTNDGALKIYDWLMARKIKEVDGE